MNDYVIPPGTENVWTPPDKVEVAPLDDEVPAADAIYGLRVQGLVRNQNAERVESLCEQLGQIWKDFTDKKISIDVMTAKLGDFRNIELENTDGIDNITVQNFEIAIIKMLTESHK